MRGDRFILVVRAFLWAMQIQNRLEITYYPCRPDAFILAWRLWERFRIHAYPAQQSNATTAIRSSSCLPRLPKGPDGYPRIHVYLTVAYGRRRSRGTMNDWPSRGVAQTQSATRWGRRSNASKDAFAILEAESVCCCKTAPNGRHSRKERSLGLLAHLEINLRLSAQSSVAHGLPFSQPSSVEHLLHLLHSLVNLFRDIKVVQQ